MPSLDSFRSGGAVALAFAVAGHTGYAGAGLHRRRFPGRPHDNAREYEQVRQHEERGAVNATSQISVLNLTRYRASSFLSSDVPSPRPSRAAPSRHQGAGAPFPRTRSLRRPVLSQPERFGRAALAIVVACVDMAACVTAPPLGRTPGTVESTIPPSGSTPPKSEDHGGVRRPIERCSDASAHPLAAAIDGFELPAHDDAWFSYSDGTPGGHFGREIESPEPGQRALHVTAEGWHNWGVGFGVQLGSPTSQHRSCEVDASAYDGIRFRARGHGSLRVNVTTTPLVSIAEGGACALGASCYDWPGSEVRLTSAWTTFELRFCGLFPVGWGRESATVDPHRLYAVHFRLAENEMHDSLGRRSGLHSARRRPRWWPLRADVSARGHSVRSDLGTGAVVAASCCRRSHRSHLRATDEKLWSADPSLSRLRA